MKRFFFFAALAFTCCFPCAAQDRGTWGAASSTAKAITGDLVILEARVSINLLTFPIAQIRTLTPPELSALFDAGDNRAAVGTLYRMNISSQQQFAHHNTLCGTEQTQWMATYVEGKTLHVAFFSGSDIPKITFESVNSGADLCGVFTYSR